jgi:hypothetical protein
LSGSLSHPWRRSYAARATAKNVRIAATLRRAALAIADGMLTGATRAGRAQSRERSGAALLFDDAADEVTAPAIAGYGEWTLVALASSWKMAAVTDFGNQARNRDCKFGISIQQQETKREK